MSLPYVFFTMFLVLGGHNAEVTARFETRVECERWRKIIVTEMTKMTVKTWKPATECNDISEDAVTFGNGPVLSVP